MLLIPTRPIPNQTVQVQLAGQPCSIRLYQSAYGMFCDVYVGSAILVAGVIVENLNRIVRSAYLGFAGDFLVGDTQGDDDPIYTGMGDRWQLAYLEESDLDGSG